MFVYNPSPPSLLPIRRGRPNVLADDKDLSRELGEGSAAGSHAPETSGTVPSPSVCEEGQAAMEDERVDEAASGRDATECGDGGAGEGERVRTAEALALDNG